MKALKPTPAQEKALARMRELEAQFGVARARVKIRRADLRTHAIVSVITAALTIAVCLIFFSAFPWQTIAAALPVGFVVALYLRPPILGLRDAVRDVRRLRKNLEGQDYYLVHLRRTERSREPTGPAADFGALLDRCHNAYCGRCEVKWEHPEADAIKLYLYFALLRRQVFLANEAKDEPEDLCPRCGAYRWSRPHKAESIDFECDWNLRECSECYQIRPEPDFDPEEDDA